MTQNLEYVLFLIAYGYLFLAVFYLFVLSVWGRFFSKKEAFVSVDYPPQKKIAILVPAYREDEVILFTAGSLLQLDYPKELFDVYIIADSFQPHTLSSLQDLPVHVLKVSFDNSTKSKSLNTAFALIDEQYDIALITDGDNILASDFLKRINGAFLNGVSAVQGRRVAKNLDTPFAVLDACSEAINNHLFRKGTNAIGLSSAICGSGMAFEYNSLRETMADIDAVGGFDKVLQLKLQQQGIFVYYMEEALIYDEKVDSPIAFGLQRRRWVASQLIYARKFFLPAFRQLLKGNVSYFNLAIANYCLLPRILLLVALSLLTLMGFFLQKSLGIMAAGLWLIYLASLRMALPEVLINADLLRAIMRLPKAIFIMIGALFAARKTDEEFLHTPHTRQSIVDPGKDRI